MTVFNGATPSLSKVLSLHERNHSFGLWHELRGSPSLPPLAQLVKFVGWVVVFLLLTDANVFFQKKNKKQTQMLLSYKLGEPGEWWVLVIVLFAMNTYFSFMFKTKIKL